MAHLYSYSPELHGDVNFEHVWGNDFITIANGEVWVLWSELELRSFALADSGFSQVYIVFKRDSSHRVDFVLRADDTDVRQQCYINGVLETWDITAIRESYPIQLQIMNSATESRIQYKVETSNGDFSNFDVGLDVDIAEAWKGTLDLIIYANGGTTGGIAGLFENVLYKRIKTDWVSGSIDIPFHGLPYARDGFADLEELSP